MRGNGVEILEAANCDCIGCDAERKVRTLIEQSHAAAEPEIKRISALPYRDTEALHRVRMAVCARNDAIVASFGRWLVGCTRLRIRVQPRVMFEDVRVQP